MIQRPHFNFRFLLLLLLLSTSALEAAPTVATSEMSPLQAAVLGVVEGLTEYLPVSSTGHLILAQRAMGMGVDPVDSEAADAYAICIQLGAILAVAGLYFAYLRRMLAGLFGRDPEGLRLVINLLAGFLPAAIIGLLFIDAIKARLFGLWPTVIAWLVGGVVILLIERRKGGPPGKAEGDLFSITPRQALLIGLMQCLAMWPGTSRSLVTILGGRMVGLSLQASVMFSFLLGMITLGASTLYDGLKHGQVMLDAYGPLSLGVGFLFALISAALAVKWMVSYLKRHGLGVFGWYRIALALVVAALLAGGQIAAG